MIFYYLTGAYLAIGAMSYAWIKTTLHNGFWSDEEIYINLTKSILDGNILFPVYSGSRQAIEQGVFLEKPPLSFWLQAVTYELFGQAEWAFRLPSVLALGATILIIYKISYHWWSQSSAIIAVITLLSMGQIWGENGATWGETDMLLTAFGTMSIIIFLLSIYYGSWEYSAAAGLLGGATVMTKGPAAIPFILISLPILLRYSGVLKQLFIAVSAAILVALPWHILAYIKYPETLVEQYILEQSINRASGSITTENTMEPGITTLISRLTDPSLFENVFGLVPLLLICLGVIFLVVTYNDGFDWKGLFSLWWFIIPILFYLPLGGFHQWYLLPSTVGGALLSGYTIHKIMILYD